MSIAPPTRVETSRARAVARRDILLGAGGGFGQLVVAALFGRAPAIGASRAVARSGEASGRTVHHRPRVRRVIQLFMNGGASPMDTFDYKPRLAELHGRRFDPGANAQLESVTGSPGFKVLKSPFEFRRRGECGRWVSEVFPHVATQVDDIAFLLSMASKSNVHGLASYMQNTGFTEPGFPCVGAWISYALGDPNENLPAFVALPDARGLPYNNRGNFSAAFLGAEHQATVISNAEKEPIPFLRPPPGAEFITPASERDGRALLRWLDERRLHAAPHHPGLAARLESYELAARMQLAAPELFDLSRETRATRRLYGIDSDPTRDFGLRCLLARRMVERGVRFVQVWSGAGGPKDNWDNHANIRGELPRMAAQTDRPIAGLLEDLKSRGLFDDTLVIWTTEFGRMPFSQGQAGRDHNAGTFVTWLAGGGVRGGVAHGESDEWGWKAREPIWSYDLHATVLHLLGIDHTRLSVRHNGIDRRLTDVHGSVIESILA